MSFIKVYVLGYRPEESGTGVPNEEGERPQKPSPIVVGYTDDPQWKMAYRAEADLQCSMLNTRAVRVVIRRAAVELEAYRKITAALDEIEPFLKWVKLKNNPSS